MKQWMKRMCALATGLCTAMTLLPPITVAAQETEVTAPVTQTGYVPMATESQTMVQAMAETAAQTIMLEGIEYTIYDDQVHVTGSDKEISGTIRIPSTVEGKPVTVIGENAFSERNNLSAVFFGEYTTTVGERAFYKCSKLTAVYLNQGLLTLEDQAFSYCNTLETFQLPEGLQTIGAMALEMCNINSITIPESVTTIGYAAFRGTSLKSVTVPDTVTDFGSSMFYNCYGLETVHLGKGISKMDDYIFGYCKNLKNVTYAGSIQSIGYRAFIGCTQLTDFDIPETVGSIGLEAFSGCTGLKKITIPETIASIDSEAFENCTGLEEICFKGYPRTTGEQIFQGVTAVALYPEGAQDRYDLAKSAYSGTLTWQSYEAEHIPGEWIIGKEPTLEEEGRWEMHCVDCDLLLATETMQKLVGGSCGDHVTWLLNPNTGLMTISGTGEMYDYNWSRCITAPWDDYSFYLKEVVVEEGVTHIGDSAFYECQYLKKITLAESVTSVGFEVIWNCYSLSRSVSYFASQEAYYLGTKDNPYHALVQISDYNYWGYDEFPEITLNVTSGCKVIADQLQDYTDRYYLGVKLPDSVQYIGHDAFCYAPTFNLPSNLICVGASAFANSKQSGSLSLPGSVKNWGNGVFRGCKNLTSVYIPKSVCVIPGAMFDGCTGLYNLYIQEGITKIGNYAFADCSQLTELTIPDSVTHIGDYAFDNCTGLTTVYVGRGLKTAESGAFSSCDPIEKVYIEDMAAWCAIDFEGNDSNPFYYAKYLYLNGALVEDLVIPEGVTSIGDYAFVSDWEGSTLKTITIPASLKSIGEGAFSNTYIRHFYITDIKNWCDCQVADKSIVNASPSYLYVNGEMVTELVVPEGVTTLREEQFRFLGGISKVTLPQSLEVIEKNAFDICLDLTQITIPAGVKYIGTDAIESGRYVLSIYFQGDAPELEGTIGYASKTTYICYPSDAAGWTEEYMSGWNGKYVWVPDHSIPTYDSDGNADCVTDGTQTGTCQYCGTVVTVPMPATGHTPGEWIIVHEPTPEEEGLKERRCVVCDEVLETMTLNPCASGTCGENVTWHLDMKTGVLTISGTGAMMDGTQAAIPWKKYSQIITSAVIEEGVTTLSVVAFDECANLTTVTLPQTLTTIGDYAFFECASLSQINLPDGLTDIGSRAFCYCTSLTEIAIPQGVTQLKYATFLECDNLTTVTLPDTMTVLESRAFINCDNLNNVRLPAALTVLGDQSFYKCISLTAITIPQGVTSVGSEAFYNCHALKEITFTGDAPEIAADAFKNVTATAYYPADWEQTALQDYKGTITWVAVEKILPTITLKFPTVTFEDEIVMNIYFEITDPEQVEQMGLLTYDAQPQQPDMGTGDHVIEGYSYSDREQLYVVLSQGIAAKDMEKPLYFAVYAKLKDGSYVYSQVKTYTPAEYAKTLLTTGSAEMKSLMAATLSYGGAAQRYFGTGGSLSETDLTVIEAYRADMMDPVVQPDASKIGDFQESGGFSNIYPTVSFEGAFSINYYCAPANVPVRDVQLYYWTAEDFSKAQTLTAQNATGILTMDGSSGTFHAVVEGIAAKDLDDTVYVACVYSDGTNTWCSGVLAYSIGAYCVTLAANTGALADFAAATAVYGYYAKQIFG